MHDYEVEELRRILIQRKQDLQAVALSNEHALYEQLHPDDTDAQVDVNHPADKVLADPDYEKQITLIRRERAELAMVTGALARIDQQRYGICEECGSGIPLERLRAIPYTKYCIECKDDKDAAAQLNSKTLPGRDPHDVGNLGL